MKIAALILASAMAISSTAAEAQQRFFARSQLNTSVSGPTGTTPPTGGVNGGGNGSGNGAGSGSSYAGAWNAAAFGPWDSGCSASALRTRTVSCVANGSLVADSQCNPAERPAATETGSSTALCGDVLTNASFEQGKDSGNWGWQDNGIWQGYSPNALGGSNIAQLQGTNFQTSQTPKHLKAGSRYRVTITAWPTNPNFAGTRIELRAVSSGNVLGSSVVSRPGSDQGWRQVTLDFVYQAGAYVDVRSLNGAWWIDHMTLDPLP